MIFNLLDRIAERIEFAKVLKLSVDMSQILDPDTNWSQHVARIQSLRDSLKFPSNQAYLDGTHAYLCQKTKRFDEGLVLIDRINENRWLKTINHDSAIVMSTLSMEAYMLAVTQKSPFRLKLILDLAARDNLGWKPEIRAAIYGSAAMSDFLRGDHESALTKLNIGEALYPGQIKKELETQDPELQPWVDFVRINHSAKDTAEEVRQQPRRPKCR